MPTPATTIKRARQAHGYSQYQLADLVSVTQPAIHLWESDQRTPRPRYAARLEQALGLPSGSLLEHERLPTQSAESRDHDHAEHADVKVAS